MSRIGRKPIPVPAGVNVAIEPERVTVNGPPDKVPPATRFTAGFRMESDQKWAPSRDPWTVANC